MFKFPVSELSGDTFGGENFVRGKFRHTSNLGAPPPPPLSALYLEGNGAPDGDFMRGKEGAWRGWTRRFRAVAVGCTCRLGRLGKGGEPRGRRLGPRTRPGSRAHAGAPARALCSFASAASQEFMHVLRDALQREGMPDPLPAEPLALSDFTDLCRRLCGPALTDLEIELVHALCQEAGLPTWAQVLRWCGGSGVARAPAPSLNPQISWRQHSLLSPTETSPAAVGYHRASPSPSPGATTPSPPPQWETRAPPREAPPPPAAVPAGPERTPSELHELLQEHLGPSDDLMGVFRDWDTDMDGMLSPAELAAGAARLGLPGSAAQWGCVHQRLRPSNRGLTVGDFMRGLRSAPREPVPIRSSMGPSAFQAPASAPAPAPARSVPDEDEDLFLDGLARQDSDPQFDRDPPPAAHPSDRANRPGDRGPSAGPLDRDSPMDRDRVSPADSGSQQQPRRSRRGRTWDADADTQSPGGRPRGSPKAKDWSRTWRGHGSESDDGSEARAAYRTLLEGDRERDLLKQRALERRREKSLEEPSSPGSPGSPGSGKVSRSPKGSPQGSKGTPPAKPPRQDGVPEKVMQVLARPEFQRLARLPPVQLKHALLRWDGDKNQAINLHGFKQLIFENGSSSKGLPSPGDVRQVRPREGRRLSAPCSRHPPFRHVHCGRSPQRNLGVKGPHGRLHRGSRRAACSVAPESLAARGGTKGGCSVYAPIIYRWGPIL